MDEIMSKISIGVSATFGGVWSLNQIFQQQLIASVAPETLSITLGLGAFLASGYTFVSLAGGNE
jgi:hypothetical protein